jgi:hypothetical protein
MTSKSIKNGKRGTALEVEYLMSGLVQRRSGRQRGKGKTRASQVLKAQERALQKMRVT